MGYPFPKHNLLNFRKQHFCYLTNLFLFTQHNELKNMISCGFIEQLVAHSLATDSHQ